MPMTREQILLEARQLPANERESLIEDLRQTGDEDFSPEQLAELRKRVEALRRGDTQTISSDQVFREMFSALRGKQ